MQWLNDGTDGQTDRRILDKFHRPCSAYYAGSINNSMTSFAYQFNLKVITGHQDIRQKNKVQLTYMTVLMPQIC